MDLRLYARVLLRFWLVLLVGLTLAASLGVLSYYELRFDDSGPKLTPRSEELWQSESLIFLTEPGFPAGRRVLDLVPVTVGEEVTFQPEFNPPDRYTGLAPLYAKLAQSDRVRALIERDGPLKGAFLALPTADTSTRRESPLPMVSLYGRGPTPAAAEETVQRGKDAFLAYLRSQQSRADIPQEKRVTIETLNEPQPAQLVVPRKKTLPFVVFLAVLFATLALIFVLENTRPAIRALPERPVTDVRRSA